jgi:hypothetical protein
MAGQGETEEAAVTVEVPKEKKARGKRWVGRV